MNFETNEGNGNANANANAEPLVGNLSAKEEVKLGVADYFPIEFIRAKEKVFSAEPLEIKLDDSAEITNTYVGKTIDKVDKGKLKFADPELVALLDVEGYVLSSKEERIVYVPNESFQTINKVSKALSIKEGRIGDERDFWEKGRFNYPQIDPESKLGKELAKMFGEDYKIVPVCPEGGYYDDAFISNKPEGFVRCVILVRKKTVAPFAEDLYYSQNKGTNLVQ